MGDDPDEELLAGILGVVGMTEKPQGQAVHRMLELADQRREGLAVAPQVTFLVRTLAAALVALSPAAWAARRRDGTSAQRSVLIGLAGYLFASSLIDLYQPVAETACPMFGASRLGQWSACGRTPGPNRGRWEPADAWDHGAVPLGSSG